MSYEPAASPLELGLKDLENDRFADAVRQFSLVLETDPGNVEALRKRSDAFYYNGEFQLALADIDRAISLAPTDARLYLDRAELKNAVDETADILEDIEKSLTIDPNSVEAYWRLAYHWIFRSRWKEAEEALKQASALAPNDYRVLASWSIVRFWTGKIDESFRIQDQLIELLKTELDSGKRDRPRLQEYANSLLFLCRNEDALEILDECRTRFPNLPFDLPLRGRAHLAMGKPEAAKKDFDRAREMLNRLSIWDNNLLLALCDYYLEQENWDEAEHNASEVLKNKPNDLAAMESMLRILRVRVDSGMNRLAEALEIADRFCRLVPDYYNAYLHRYWFRGRGGRFKSAKGDFEQAMVLLPEEPSHRLYAVNEAISTGQYSVAREWLNGILSADPDHIDALWARAWLWNVIGIHDCAVRDYTRLIELLGPEVAWLQGRANALAEVAAHEYVPTSFDKALKDYEEALEREPKNPELWRGIAMVRCKKARRTWFGKSALYQKAIEELDEAIRLEKNATFYYFRALVYWELWDHDAAVDDCSEAIRLNPDYLEALHLRAEIHLRLKETDRADTDFEAIDRIEEKRHIAPCDEDCDC